MTYEITYETKNVNLPLENLKAIAGVEMRRYFKRGKQIKQYISENGDVVREVFLDIDNSISYLLFPKNDTIFWYDTKEPDSRSFFEVAESKVIYNQDCVGMSVRTLVTGPGFRSDTIEQNSKFYFSKKYKIRPSWFKNYKEGNYNEIIKIGGGIEMRSEIEYEHYNIILNVIEVDERRLKKNELQLNASGRIIEKQI